MIPITARSAQAPAPGSAKFPRRSGQKPANGLSGLSNGDNAVHVPQFTVDHHMFGRGPVRLDEGLGLVYLLREEQEIVHGVDEERGRLDGRQTIGQ